MPNTTPLADVQDVADIWRPLSADETDQVTSLIDKASRKLRQACPFDIDQRIALYETEAGDPDTPNDPLALDPVVVADVVATIVKRFMVNIAGYASESETKGPFSHSATFVNRYDKTGSDVRGAIQIIESDIDQLRPAVPAEMPGSFSYALPKPGVLIPGDRLGGRPAVVPDVFPDLGAQ